jgi:hypothetical protein
MAEEACKSTRKTTKKTTSRLTAGVSGPDPRERRQSGVAFRAAVKRKPRLTLLQKISRLLVLSVEDLSLRLL